MTQGAAALEPGRIRLGVRLSVGSATRELDTNVTLRYLFLDVQLEASVELSRRLAVDVGLPLRLVYRRVEPGGEPQLRSGPGDLSLAARLRVLAHRRIMLDVIGGATLPSGATQALQPGLAYEQLLFGSGTVDPLLGLELTMPLGPVSLLTWGRVRASVDRNAHGVRNPTRISTGLALRSGLGTRRLTLIVHPELAYETPGSSADGELEQESGRTDLVLGATVTYAVHRALSLVAQIKTPVVLHAHGDQPRVPFVALLGIDVSWQVRDR